MRLIRFLRGCEHAWHNAGVVVTHRDRIRQKIPDLPASAVRPLSVRGVPHEVNLPGWTGPTFFTSELRDGCLRTVDAFAPGLAESCGVSGWVLGSMRDRSAWAGDEVGAFVVQERTGHVLLLDLEQGERPRFVNSSAALFLDAIDVFLQWWRSEGQPELELRRIRDDLKRIDPPAMASPRHHWPVWLDDLRDA
jgi:SUKH-4 immunity protein